MSYLKSKYSICRWQRLPAVRMPQSPFLFCVTICFLPLTVLSLPPLILDSVLVRPGVPTNTSLLNIAAPKPKPEPEPGVLLTCLQKPSFYFIDDEICKPVFDSLLHAPSSKTVRTYGAASIDFGWSPCHISLKKSTGSTVIRLSIAQIVDTASTIVNSCRKNQGAGWGQFWETQPWYLLVHGDRYQK